MNEINTIHPVDTAAKVIGGRERMAKVLGVSVAAVGNWKNRGVPYEKCVAIERATSGAVTRQDLRPHDWADIWPELAASRANVGECATQSVAGQGA